MPVTDFWFVVRWWGALFFVGAAAYPLTRLLFSSWHDRGYFFAKAIGAACVTWFVYILGMAKVAPFTTPTILGSVIGIFVFGLLLQGKSDGGLRKDTWKKRGMSILFEEGIFFIALLFWAWIKAHEPSIRGLEKFMDYGFMQSALRSRFFPPADMWYPPFSVNYYYFGHLVTALFTKLSGLDLGITFNLMLATIFAQCLTLSYSIGHQLLKDRRRLAIIGGVLTSLLVTVSGNMQTIYAFTRGYTGDDVKPFWQLLWGAGEIWQKLGEGMETYWYANATRFIPFTIHEFPSYSFVVSDVHGHVLSIPFVLLSIGLLIAMFGSRKQDGQTWLRFGFYGFLSGILLMTNALDGPMYVGLFFMLLSINNWHLVRQKHMRWKPILLPFIVVLFGVGITSLPFLAHFKSFVNGIAINCPLPFLANSKLGPILFEGVEKCQRSPLWMMWLLWGFFWYCGSLLLFGKINKIKDLWDIKSLWNTKFTHVEKFLSVLFVFSFALIIFPEFFYFKDIYPQHFRSNTMFKLGYQAFIMWSIVSGYVITQLIFVWRSHARKVFILLLVPQLFLVLIYPIFSVRSYFGGLRQYEGIYGLTWLAREYPGDYSAILWFGTTPRSGNLVEADGDSYTDYERFSVFTGIPTPVGWAVHEWLWRGSYDAVSPRREDVRKMYESESIDETNALLDQYDVRYIVVGSLERQKFTNLAEWKFEELGRMVYQSGDTRIYERTN